MSTLAKLFAMADADEQSGMLNEAGKTLRRVCDNEHYADIQLCRIADGLNEDGKWLVRRVAEFLECDEGKR